MNKALGTLLVRLELSSEQVLELQQPLVNFNQVLQNQLDCTVLAEHQIETGMAHPVRSPPYRLL